MASEVLGFWHYVGNGPTIGNPVTVLANSSTAFPIVESDGTIDGQLAVGGAVSFSDPVLALGGTLLTLVGFTSADEPIFQDVFLDTYMFSNANYPDGAVLATTTTGTYNFCFAAGTGIAGPEGETLVEDLEIGDLITTADGRNVPVKWVGHQTISTRFNPAERVRPVQFAAGSLGGGLPHCALTVTADHAMLVDGVLCVASALVNGSTITRVPLAEMGERFTVYHVETEAHDIILANGAASETYIDHASRRSFDNFAEYAALYGGEGEVDELSYPRVTSARQLPAHVRARLGLDMARAG